MVANITFVYAAKMTSAANAIALQFTSPIFITGLETAEHVTAVLLSTLEPVLNPIWAALFYNEVIWGCFFVWGKM